MATQKDMSGSLKKNPKKTTDSHPDYRGTCTIAGVRYWISSWINADQQTGEKYMGLRFEPIVDKQDQPKPQQQQQPRPSDDDVPF